MQRQTFVARERELEQLDNFLTRILIGQGRVCFVTGEAGIGKTALVAEFARRAQKQHENLIVAVGQCDSLTGAGDPYLPFREILGQLTGDVDTALSEGAITRENANRLKQLMRLSGQVLVEIGPDLIGLFVPGIGLAARLGTFIAGKVGWLKKLEQIAESSQKTTPGSVDIDQSHIFEQYTNVLKTLATQYPLLLVLDDLQWADAASIELLFRLVRRIKDSRILILGTYRPEEVALGRDGEHHPLEKVLTESKRYLGHISVDLDQTEETERQRFVNAFLDTEPNLFSEEFRRALRQHTDGNPLFTVELLKDMKERKDVVQDERGRWIASSVLNWDALPARVEGVIEERIGRLEDELRQYLTVGSVEGEDFTAEVVARLHEKDARKLVRRLSRELDKQHHLVIARGIRRLNGQRLSFYQFQHNLFQKYLYDDLDEVERAYLHEDVGNILEELYGDRVDEIVVQLARHFVEAGVLEKATHYSYLAGKQAADKFANDEAVAHLSRALDLAPEDDSEMRYTILLTREKVYDLQGKREAQAQDLADLVSLAEALEDDQRRAEVSLRQANYAEATGNYPRAQAAVERALGTYRSGNDVVNHAICLTQLGLIARKQGDYDKAKSWYEQARGLFQDRDAYLNEERQVLIQVLNGLGIVHRQQGHFDESKACYERALTLSRTSDNRMGEAEALNNLGVTAFYQRCFDEALTYYRQALDIRRTIGDRAGEVESLGNLAQTVRDQGDYGQAKSYLSEALDTYQAIGDRWGEINTWNDLSILHHELGDLSTAQTCLQQGMALAREVGDESGQAYLLCNLGQVLCDEGKLNAAEKALTDGLALAQAQDDRYLASNFLSHLGLVNLLADKLDQAIERANAALTMRRETDLLLWATADLATLSAAHLASGEKDKALDYAKQAMAILDECGGEGPEFPHRDYFLCYQVLSAIGQEEIARAALQSAYDLVTARAKKITDPDLRQSFLENGVRNREIVDAWQAMQVTQ